MDSSGVDKALLIQNPTIGNKMTIFLNQSNNIPIVFGSVQVDMYDPDAAEQVATYAENPLVKVLKLEISEEYGWTGIYPKLQVCDSPEMQAIWEVVETKISELFMISVEWGIGPGSWISLRKTVSENEEYTGYNRALWWHEYGFVQGPHGR